MPVLVRILNMQEFCIWYGLGRTAIRKMLKTGQLQGIRTPAGWRIPDPGPVLLERMRQQAVALEQAPFIRGVEVAELVGLTPRWVRRMAEQGLLPSTRQGKRRLYKLADVLDLMDQRRKKVPRRGSGTYIRPEVIRWASQVMKGVKDGSPLLSPFAGPVEPGSRRKRQVRLLLTQP